MKRGGNDTVVDSPRSRFPIQDLPGRRSLSLRVWSRELAEPRSRLGDDEHVGVQGHRRSLPKRWTCSVRSHCSLTAPQSPANTPGPSASPWATGSPKTESFTGPGGLHTGATEQSARNVLRKALFVDCAQVGRRWAEGRTLCGGNGSRAAVK
ncbi:unnamed protein product [Gadus morhua 'NCC']